MTELALPAGSLQSALAAFTEGADAVYLGMKSFSARKMAANFSFEDLAKLRQVSLSQDKKIYVTVNTLVDDSQLGEVVSTLKQLAFIGCDGIIVQDLGLVEIIRTQFPSLALHASTQLAVHTIEGVRELVRLGFERVVLARELTFEEIKNIRQACPDVQLKVFIHGALCYSFSGLCMASEQLCGRSANCGACAQICRNYFSVSPDPEVSSALSPIPKTVRDGWFFSMSDLKAGPLVKELEKLGIESLKVEGRMKSPAYTSLAGRYYRAILDGRSDTEEMDEALSIVFSRRQTAGWLAGYGRTRQDFSIRRAPTLGSTSFPSHRGLKAGTIVLVKEGRALIRLERTLSLRDGLMYFIKGTREPVETVKFGLSELLDQRGRSITEAHKGETVQINLPAGSPLPQAGEHVMVISRHDQNPALFSEALPLVKKPVDMRIVIGQEGLTLWSSHGTQFFPLPVSQAKKRQETEANLARIFSQSDTSYFTLGTLSVDNQTSYRMDELFLPLSALKAARRAWYESLDRNLARFFTSTSESKIVPDKQETETLPPRSLLQTLDPLPFLDLKLLRRKREQGKAIASLLFPFEDRLFLPLSPVMFDEQQFFDDLDYLVAAMSEEGVLDQVRFGLNNIGQASYFRKRQLACFFDIYFYLGNSEAAKLALSMGLDSKGGYLWMEQSEGDFSTWPFTPAIVETSFKPPLFISRSCFRHDSLMLSCEGCPHRGSWYVKGDKDRYKVLVEDCITYLVRA
ncbi:MAG TPA: peptidase U32 [Sphaerochaeta sp.]|nr:peptidase U32 [Sphaerochaeta sp.]